MKEWFRRVSCKTAEAVGSPTAFGIAILTIVIWAATGPIFHFSDTWQLIINTGTTIITFLMVFLIQNAQNRESRILQLKISELIRAIATARNDLINLDEMSDDQLETLHSEFKTMHDKLHAHVEGRRNRSGKSKKAKDGALTK